MKLNIKSVKSVTPNKNMIKKVVAVVISIIVMITSYIAIDRASADAVNTVAVVRVKKEDGIEMSTPIKEEDIEVYNVVKAEYTEDMILAEDIDSVVNMYSLYYLRHNGILYKDQLGGERPITNEWLYQLGEDEEAITIPYDYLKCGGDILMPGDCVRIRATYESEVSEADAGWYGGNENSIQYKDGNDTKSTTIIFDSIEVKDMLNEKSHSIYEIYKQVLRMDEAERQKLMKSDEFIKSILPRALVLSGNKQEINEYAKYANLKEGELLITILSRKNSNPIIDQLPTLQSEVQSWIETNDN